MKRFIIFCLMVSFLFTIAAESDGIKTIDLDNLEKGKVKAGLELAMPVTGLTAGYHMSEKMEFNLLIGSMLDFSQITLGANLMYTMVNLDIQDQIFPLNLGPVFYATFGSEVWLSLGAELRLEYDFDFPLNLYVMSGLIYNISRDDGDDPFSFPFGIGARYIF